MALQARYRRRRRRGSRRGSSSSSMSRNTEVVGLCRPGVQEEKEGEEKGN